jgi:hypothetical protein
VTLVGVRQPPRIVCHRCHRQLFEQRFCVASPFDSIKWVLCREHQAEYQRIDPEGAARAAAEASAEEKRQWACLALVGLAIALAVAAENWPWLVPNWAWLVPMAASVVPVLGHGRHTPRTYRFVVRPPR